MNYPEKVWKIYSPVPNNKGVLIKVCVGGRGEGRRVGGGGLTDNLNINKRVGPNKRGGTLKIVLGHNLAKWQPVVTNYGNCFN